MDRRTFKNFIMKRSSIWTLSLCLTGVLTFGGIAWLDNAIRGDEKQQIEKETEQELNVQEYDLAEASGSTVDVEEYGDTGLVNGNLVQEKILDEEGVLDEMADDQLNHTEETVSVSETEMEDIEEVSSNTIISEQMLMDAGIAFYDTETLLWPSAGTILIDYSMDSSVYFSTLNQYKYNPALIIGSDVGNQVLASTAGIVESISIDEETGTTLVMNIGNGYKLTYGQLKELTVTEGEIVEAGAVLGYVSEPTKYFVKEGSNLYFGMTYEGQAVDPVLYLEG